MSEREEVGMEDGCVRMHTEVFEGIYHHEHRHINCGTRQLSVDLSPDYDGLSVRACICALCPLELAGRIPKEAPDEADVRQL